MIRLERGARGSGETKADDDVDHDGRLRDERDRRCNRWGVCRRRAGRPALGRNIVVAQMMNRVFRDLEHKRQQDDGDTGSRHPAPMTDRMLAHKGPATGKATTPQIRHIDGRTPTFPCFRPRLIVILRTPE